MSIYLKIFTKSIVKLAPGAYHPEKATVNTAPKYSFGLKTIHEKPNETPGMLIPFMIIINSVASFVPIIRPIVTKFIFIECWWSCLPQTITHLNKTDRKVTKSELSHSIPNL